MTMPINELRELFQLMREFQCVEFQGNDVHVRLAVRPQVEPAATVHPSAPAIKHPMQKRIDQLGYGSMFEAV